MAIWLKEYLERRAKPAPAADITWLKPCTGGCGKLRQTEWESAKCWSCRVNEPTGTHALRGTLPYVKHNGGCSNQNALDPHGKWVGAGQCACNIYGRDWIENDIGLLPIPVLEARIRAEKAIAADTPVPPDAPGAIAPSPPPGPWGSPIGMGVCGMTVCTCGPFGPTAASGHMQSCPLYTRPVAYQVVATTGPFASCTALVNDTIVCGRPI